MRPWFADLDAFVPRVTDISIASTAAVSEPRTAAATTTAFPRFRDGAAFAAFGPAGFHRRGCCNLYVSICQETNKETLSSHCLVMQLHLTGLELTFAGLHAFRPPVINIFAAEASTVLEPSTARSTTTASAGFLERAAFGTRHSLSDRCGDGWGAD